jgi:hypothetical protein
MATVAKAGSKMIPRVFSLATNMTRITPSVSETTEAEIVPEDEAPATSAMAEATETLNSLAGNGAGTDPAQAASGHHHAASGQATVEQIAGASQPTGEGSLGPTKRARGLFVRLALQVAEHYRQVILLRQPHDLLVQHRPEFTRSGLRRNFRDRKLGNGLFVKTAAASPSA